MMNFICLVILPLLFGGAIIAVFMYCCQYLLTYIKEYVNKVMDDTKSSEHPKRTSK